MSDKIVRIGGASGYWGDTMTGPAQLVERGGVDYLVFDYLAEVTMSILARARAKSEDAGYAIDFVTLAMRPLIRNIAEKGIKVVANAGGVNLGACQRALQAVCEEAGVRLKVGVVGGDDLMPRLEELRRMGVREMSRDAPLPDEVMSVNAYLGALPIAAALDAGADIVVTGRCVDSAVTLGPLIHEFGWAADDYDRLAAGTLAGHILECGAQCTGGNFTDWRDVVGGWDDMGYPIAECRADGSFVLTKPEGTGGLVSPLTVGEQMLYEVGDPQAYIVPDAVCDFSGVTMEQDGPDRVRVTGARGAAPTATYKVSATHMDGFRSSAGFVITGFEAVEKATAEADAILKKTRRLFRQRNLGDYRRTARHLIGAETLWGENAGAGAASTREVMMRLDVHHDERDALEIFSKEVTGSALCMSTGYCAGGPGGRPRVSPLVRLFSFLIDKGEVPVTVDVDGAKAPIAIPTAGGYAPRPRVPAGDETPADGPSVTVALIDLAVARSGDKGNDANIGVIARRPDYLPAIRRALGEAAVAKYFGHVLEGEVERFELPGIGALNFVLHETLDGGGVASLHLDPLAKTFAQQLLAHPVEVPEAWAEELGARKRAAE